MMTLPAIVVLAILGWVVFPILARLCAGLAVIGGGVLVLGWMYPDVALLVAPGLSDLAGWVLPVLRVAIETLGGATP